MLTKYLQQPIQLPRQRKKVSTSIKFRNVFDSTKICQINTLIHIWNDHLSNHYLLPLLGMNKKSCFEENSKETSKTEKK